MPCGMDVLNLNISFIIRSVKAAEPDFAPGPCQLPQNSSEVSVWFYALATAYSLELLNVLIKDFI